MKISLPLPPPVNATYKIGNRRLYKSARAIDWEQEVSYLLQKPINSLKGALFANVDMFLKRDRDIDGSLKLLLDILEDKKFYENDSQIEMLLIRKYKLDKKSKELPHLEIDIQPLVK